MRTLFRPRTPLSAVGGHSRFLFRLAQCVPFLIVLLGLGIELSPAHVVYTGPLLIAMPALASLTMGPKGTLAAAGGALIVSVTTTTLHQAWGDQQIYSNLLALVVVSAASVMTSNAVRTRRQSELDRIHRIAAAAQRALLRPVSARLDQVQVASMYLAAEAGAQIGGDLYEAVSTRYGVRMIVGDVRGKGLPAVRSAAAVLGAFREAVHYENDLVEVMNHCSAALNRDCAVPTALGQEEEADIGEDFVTALAAQVVHGSVLQVVNCGHPPPLVLRQGKIEALHPASPRPPLGLEDIMNGSTAGPDSYVFAPGDRLLLYTDGVVEARNIDNDFFPLPEALEAAPACTPPDFLEWLHQALVRHTRGQLTDDVAVLVIDRFRDDAESEAAEDAIAAGPPPSR
ncbi:PP2C family protein-serine/threonine phosphatase [Streptomyces sp. NPDC048197]|uniref:PP2C family protein-serine/threonine phosphatase n=1 Tax=Streptomyces sp. NPDC048197 TaxID=3365511 RepID=UPI0037226FFF